MKKIIRQLLQRNFGKKGMQAFYETLFKISLKGMNYGNGGDFKASGELHVLGYIKSKLAGEEPLVLFDVGANIGNYSKALAQFFDQTATVHSFEPSKKTFERLLKTTASIKNIVTNNFGLGDTENNVVLYSNKEGSGLASVYQRNLAHVGILMNQSEEIEISTIDNYCKKKNINRIHFLKLDIEGHELSALKGADQMLKAGKINFIQFEFGGTNLDSRTYFKDFFYLLTDKYRIYRVLKDGLLEIPHYKITQEVFVSINYIAEVTL